VSVAAAVFAAAVFASLSVVEVVCVWLASGLYLGHVDGILMSQSKCRINCQHHDLRRISVNQQSTIRALKTVDREQVENSLEIHSTFLFFLARFKFFRNDPCAQSRLFLFTNGNTFKQGR
jgi:hypothetical protein